MKQILAICSGGHIATRTEFHKHGGPEVFQVVEFTPADPVENEIQIENKAIGTNFIDTYIRSGLYPSPSLPSGLDTEVAGIVGKVDSSVKHIKAGDHIVYVQSALGAYSSVYNINADKATTLPAAISFEQAAASFLKGLMVYYLLCRTYEIKPGEQLLSHAAAGGVGSITCQRAKAPGVKLIGTVGTARRAQSALKAGAWQVTNCREENLVERLKEITGGKKVRVVYDSVGRDTWERSLDCLQRHGSMVSFGNSSGAVTSMNSGILNQKGSLYVICPSLRGYIITREGLTEASNGLFSLVTSGTIKVDVAEQQKYPLKDAWCAHEILESRVAQGPSLLIP